MVRVPLGSRDVHAYVLTAPVSEEASQELKRVRERVDAPRAFTETGLALARFIAERYISTLGEALSAVVLGAALPRTVDLFVSAGSFDPSRYKSVPARLQDS